MPEYLYFGCVELSGSRGRLNLCLVGLEDLASHLVLVVLECLWNLVDPMAPGLLSFPTGLQTQEVHLSQDHQVAQLVLVNLEGQVAQEDPSILAYLVDQVNLEDLLFHEFHLLDLVSPENLVNQGGQDHLVYQGDLEVQKVPSYLEIRALQEHRDHLSFH